MRLVMTKETITATADALREATDTEERGYAEFAENEFDALRLDDRAELVDHLLAIAGYANNLARQLIDRERS